MGGGRGCHDDGVSTRVAFLRAVNLGRRKVPMKQLAEICEGLGYDDVWTHANSGNAVFDATGKRDAIERAVGTALEDALGFEVTTFVRTAAELRRALDVHPFDVGPGDTYFLTFLKAPPSAAVRKELEAASNDFDTLVVKGRDVHWLMHGKSTDTQVKAATWRRLGEHASTSRNTHLLEQLVAKIDRR
jgi:uncharacterized protein (DUF1697 family)